MSANAVIGACTAKMTKVGTTYSASAKQASLTMPDRVNLTVCHMDLSPRLARDPRCLFGTRRRKLSTDPAGLSILAAAGHIRAGASKIGSDRSTTERVVMPGSHRLLQAVIICRPSVCERQRWRASKGDAVIIAREQSRRSIGLRLTCP